MCLYLHNIWIRLNSFIVICCRQPRPVFFWRCWFTYFETSSPFTQETSSLFLSVTAWHGSSHQSSVQYSSLLRGCSATNSVIVCFQSLHFIWKFFIVVLNDRTCRLVFNELLNELLFYSLAIYSLYCTGLFVYYRRYYLSEHLVRNRGSFCWSCLRSAQDMRIW